MRIYVIILVAPSGQSCLRARETRHRILRQRALGVCLILAVVSLIACTGDEQGHLDQLQTYAAEWNGVYDALREKAVHSSCSGMYVPDRAGFQGKIALTFDDGPRPETTSKALDTLMRHHVRASFFINGSRLYDRGGHRVADVDKILGRIRAEGHVLANHTQTHQNSAKLPIPEFVREVERTHREILATGVTPRYFRFPFGSSSCTTARIIRTDFNLISTGWHVDSADWCYAASAGECRRELFRYVPDTFRTDMLGFIVKQLRDIGGGSLSRSGGIVLLHDIHDFTVENLDAMISELKHAGLSFVAIDDINVFPRLNGGCAGDIPGCATTSIE